MLEEDARGGRSEEEEDEEKDDHEDEYELEGFIRSQGWGVSSFP